LEALSESTTAPKPQRGGLPEGTIAVAAGLVISGVCAFAFLFLSGKALPDADQRVIQQLWFWTFFLAPGCFLPLEQEVARALSHRRALGQGGLPIVRRAATIGAAVAVVLLLGVTIARPVLVKETFDGRGVAVTALMVSIIAWGLAHLGRGILSGSGRFAPYGMLMGIDGIIRVAGCVVFAALGVKSLAAYALLVGVPPFLALAISFSRTRGLLQPGPEAPWPEVTTNLGWLLLGSFASAFLLNAGPLLAQPLASVADRFPSVAFSTTTKLASRVTAFSYAILLSRLPLFMFQAVQAALLPKLARLAAAGAFAEFARGFRLLMKIVAAVAVVGVIGAWIAGPFAVGIAYKVKTSHTDMAMLALAAGVFMASIAMAQALIALHRHAFVALGWVIGLLGVGAGLVLSRDLLLRVELALVLGSLVPLVFFALTLRRALGSGLPIDAQSVTEAMLDHPLEP
jgi:O-antigen/teichoic acid export membrane protein